MQSHGSCKLQAHKSVIQQRLLDRNPREIACPVDPIYAMQECCAAQRAGVHILRTVSRTVALLNGGRGSILARTMICVGHAGGKLSGMQFAHYVFQR
jgi:hypothetical protein